MQPLEAQRWVLEVDVWVEHAERFDRRAGGSRCQEAAVVAEADVGGAVALMRLIDEANEGLDDDVIEGGLDFGLDLDEYDDDED